MPSPARHKTPKKPPGSPRDPNEGKLTDEQRAHIVARLALYDHVSDIHRDLVAQGIDISFQAVAKYNPESNVKLADRWRILFEETRKRWRDEIIAEPIADRAFRLRRLGQIHEQAMKRGALPLAAQMLEQAAKEVGNVFSNVTKGKIEHQHSHNHTGSVTIEEQRNMLSDRIGEALRAKAGAKAAATKH